MASQYRGQEVLLCALCNNSPAQKYCNTCTTSLCDSCIAKHISSNSTKSHDIVVYEMKDVGPIAPNCKTHAKQQCEMHCKECDIPVCTKCITSGAHQNHHFNDILELLKADKEKISCDTTELKALGSSIQTTINHLQTKLDELPKNHEKLMTSISKQGAEWHHEIDIIIEKRKKEAERMKIEDESILQKLQADMKNLLSAIHQVIMYNIKLFESNKFTEMKSYTSRVEEFKTLPIQFDVTLSTFTSLPVSEEQLDEMFGSLESSSLSSEGHSTTTKNISTNEIFGSLKSCSLPSEGHSTTTKIISSGEMFRSLKSSSPSSEGHATTTKNVSSDISHEVGFDINTGYEDLYDVAYLGPDDIWVRGNSRVIKRFNNRGSLQQTVTPTTGNYPGGITVTTEGELIYSDREDRSINIVRNEKVKKIIKFQDWKPNKLCYTASGDLLVSMRKDCVTPQKIARFSGHTEKQVLQFDQDRNPWFSTGYQNSLSLDENRNRDICVSDWDAKHVTVFSQAGKLRFRYKGNVSSNRYLTFQPRGICTDREGQILIADHDNNCIHIISEDGHFIRYIQNYHLCNPHDLSSDKNNTLYVTEQKTAKLRIVYLK